MTSFAFVSTALVPLSIVKPFAHVYDVHVVFTKPLLSKRHTERSFSHRHPSRSILDLNDTDIHAGLISI